MGKNFSKYFLSIMCLFFLVYLINMYIGKRDTGQPLTSGEKIAGRCTTDDFTIKDLAWHEEEKRAQGVIDSLTVTNRGDYDCKDIRGHMRFLSKDGTEVGKTDFNVHEYIQDVAVTLEGSVVLQEKQE